jgi:3-dehydroquinate synthase
MIATMNPTESTVPEEVTEINYYDLDQIDADKILEGLHSMITAAAKIPGSSAGTVEKYNELLTEPAVMSSLISLSRLPVFSTDFALAFKDNLELLRCLKQLKYFWSIPQSQLTILLKQIAVEIKGTTSQEAAALELFQKETAEMTEQVQMLARLLPGKAGETYIENADYLEIADPHAVYPTSIYRQCDGLTLATKDASTIEAVMSTAITTTIKIARDVLEPSNELLYNVYKPLGRCLAVVDDKVDAA